MIFEGDVLPARVDDFAAGPAATQGEIAAAAREQALYAGRTDMRYNALARAYDDRIREVREATGIVLENPMSMAPGMTGNSFAFSPGEIAPDILSERDRQEAFAARLAEIETQHPDKVARIRAWLDPRTEATMIQRRAEATLEDAVGSRGMLASLPAMLAGGLVGSFTDPVNLATMFVGPASTVGRTGLAALVHAGLTSAAVNAAVTAGMEPMIQAQRAEAGLKSGLSEAAQDVAWSAAFGGVLGLGIQGGVQAVRAVRGRGAAPRSAAAEAPAPVARSFDDAGVDATIRAADKVAPQMPPEARAALTRLKAEREAEGLAPKAIDVQEHLDALTAAERFLDDPEHAPPPHEPTVAERADGPAIDDSNAAGFAAEIKIGGKPATRTLVKAKDLQFDADAFQYKGGGDAQGVTEKLRSVTRWDQSSAGWIYAFERRDGTMMVADGHQRTGLAQRLMASGEATDIDLPAFVFREADGWTPAEVRARAAQKNIREGTGDVVDTATVIREKPSLLDRSVPMGSAHLRQAIALSRLSPDAFGMVRAGVIPPHLAQAIGEQAASAPELHRGLAEALVRQDVATADQARMVVAGALRLGAKDAEAKAQISLFGDDFFAQTHLVEQAKVLDGALKKLSQDARLFTLLRDKGEKIEAKGNVLDGEVNARTAQLAKIAGDLVERLARTDGPVADIVDAAARALARKELTTAKAADQVAAQVIDLFEREGLNGVINRAPRIDAPEVKPVEPATPEAVEKAEARLRAFHGSPHDVGRFDASKIGTGEGAQSFGHGLYFAENENVARTYRDMRDTNPTIEGKPIDINDPLHKAVIYRDKYGEKALDEARHYQQADPDFYGRVIAHLERGDLPSIETTGNFYEVRLNVDREHLLDWDKPLSEQSPDVQNALTQLGVQTEKNKNIMTGSSVMEFLSAERGGDKVAVSKALQDAGIPGIKYLDAGSRDGGEGTRNFVIFDDKNVEITHKNGEPVKSAERQTVLAEHQPAAEQKPAEPSAPKEATLFDMLPADGESERLVTPELIQAEAKRDGEIADMIALCNRGAARQ